MKKIGLFTGVLTVVLTTLCFAMSGKAPQPVPQTQMSKIDLSVFKNGEDIFITPSQLKERLGDPSVVILDGNHPKLYAKGHIPGAISIGFKGLSRSQGKPGDPGWGTILPREELTRKLESFGITNASLVVCYSETFKGPGAGGRAVWQMRMAGLTRVKLLYGGFSLWKAAGLPVAEDPPQITPATGLALKPYDERYRADRDFVLSHLNTLTLIDVRTRKEFTGDDTSRGEARGGHIQNALWLEWTALLKPDSTPKAPEDIINLMAVLGVAPQDEFVVY